MNQEYFHESSDIDIAVDGIPEESYYKAVGEVMNLMEGFSIDIVDLNACKTEMKKRIMLRNIEL